MPPQAIRFFKENNLFLLFTVNTFLFWLVIQSFRSIPITPDFIILFALIIVFALVLDLFFKKRFLNEIAMKLSIVAVVASNILFYTLKIPLFVAIIFLGYAWFFPEFFREVTILNEKDANITALYTVISFYLAFSASVVERMFFFSLNFVIILIVGPSISVLVLLFVKGSSTENTLPATQSNDKVPESRKKSRFFSGIATILMSCVLSVLIVVVNNPSLITITSYSSYDWGQFIVLISGALWIAIMVAFRKKIKLEKKSATILIIGLNFLVLFPFVVSFFAWQFLNIVFFALALVALLTLLMLLLANLTRFECKISFMFCITGNLMFYFLCSYFGTVLFFVLINCITLMGGFLIYIVGYKNDLHFSLTALNLVKSKKIIASGIIILVVVSMLPLLKAILQSEKSYDKKVLAFYYPWYGNRTDYSNNSLGIEDPGGKDWHHWYDANDNYAGTDTPSYGFYDCNDPELIKKHLRLASDAGIDALICSWWGIDDFTDKTFDNLLTVAKNISSEVKFTIYYEASQQRFLSGSPQEAINAMSSEITYILEEYSDSPYFFKTEDKPVIFVYSTMLYSPLMWENIIQKVKEENDCFLIADVLPVPEVKTEILSCFDGIHVYNPTFYICEQRKLFNTNDTYGTIKEMYFSMRDIAKSYGKLWAATVIPGYDDRIIRNPGMLIDRNDGDTYNDLWELCINGEADWVLVTSFNEWHEGTEIEPSEEYGNYFISRTSDWAKRFTE